MLPRPGSMTPAERKYVHFCGRSLTVVDDAVHAETRRDGNFVAKTDMCPVLCTCFRHSSARQSLSLSHGRDDAPTHSLSRVGLARTTAAYRVREAIKWPSIAQPSAPSHIKEIGAARDDRASSRRSRPVKPSTTLSAALPLPPSRLLGTHMP